MIFMFGPKTRRCAPRLRAEGTVTAPSALKEVCAAKIATGAAAAVVVMLSIATVAATRTGAATPVVTGAATAAGAAAGFLYMGIVSRVATSVVELVGADVAAGNPGSAGVALAAI